MSTVQSIVIVNDRAEIDRLTQFIELFAENHRLSPDVAFHLQLALDEIVTNVIKHGYDDGSRHEIAIRFSLGPSELVAEVEDDGREFNPLDVPPPNLELGLDDRPIGGLGIHFVRSVMTAIDYRRDGSHNVLTLRKRTS
jgi:anti-sigma regulatory factor (Ser/Thr protein kinase)